jgi:hypothetical protein
VAACSVERLSEHQSVHRHGLRHFDRITSVLFEQKNSDGRASDQQRDEGDSPKGTLAGHGHDFVVGLQRLHEPQFTLGASAGNTMSRASVMRRRAESRATGRNQTDALGGQGLRVLAAASRQVKEDKSKLTLGEQC